LNNQKNKLTDNQYHHLTDYEKFMLKKQEEIIEILRKIKFNQENKDVEM